MKTYIPQTLFSTNTKNIKEQIALLSGAPIIIKLQEGTRRLGVVLVETEKSVKSIIDTFFTMNASFMLQEYIKEHIIKFLETNVRKKFPQRTR